MHIVQDARLAMKALNGLICIYKPAGVSVQNVQNTILANLCRDLNKLDVRPPQQMVEIVGSTNAPMNVKLVTDLADHPLVVGPRYQIADFKSSYGTHLGRNTSGVLLLGINAGTSLTYKIHIGRPTRAYKIHGKFGVATDTYFANGKVVEKAGFKHVTRAKIDKVVAHMEAMHQRKMYDMSGLDMSSQAGYELATSGLIRPANAKIPVIYGLKCVHFESPNFIIEIQSIGEYEKYLHTIISDIGMQMKTVAHCTAAQCIRQARFNLDHALLRKHWQLPYIVDSIRSCGKLLEEHEELLKPKAALSL